MGIDKLEPLIISLGYYLYDEYTFEKKKLIARSYNHRDKDAPRIFVSELQRDLLSDNAQQILADLVTQIPEHSASELSIFWTGRLWQPLSVKDYRSLLAESEYAAWLASMGLQANHFTVSINHLKNLPEIEDVIALLKQNGFPVNAAGGEIKGTADTRLEQAATLADKTQVEFADNQTLEVPSCFYEFAKRYPAADGALFEGFIADNADKIFESTHAA